ncbi:hypothetical protein MA16_Dca004560 [Dendrobium catenatum]|uniref:DUF4283 domain-containing protein n=1 Tax=Dendrobium catenatum TaxID=906689 RepID=A0A2I0VNF9_9ASPA|nr:hypothetical protein MA16_Dca004560 [Dendrobium catenatum]
MGLITGRLLHREATFYEALLETIKKTWQLKGELSLLTMDDEFFLLKFTTLEDYEHAWTGAPSFSLGSRSFCRNGVQI